MTTIDPTLRLFASLERALLAELPGRPMEACAAALIAIAQCAAVAPEPVALADLIRLARREWRSRLNEPVLHDWPYRNDRLTIATAPTEAEVRAAQRCLSVVIVSARACHDEGAEQPEVLSVLMSLAVRLGAKSLAVSESKIVEAVRHAEERLGGWLEMEVIEPESEAA